MMGRQVDLSDMKSRLLAWLQKKIPQARNLAISEMERSGSGLSNESFLFDLSWEDRNGKKVLAVVLRSQPQSYPVYPEYDLGMQARIMQCLQGTDVPVPELYWYEEDRDVLGGTPFYIMSKIDGVIPPDYPNYHTSGVYFEATPEQRSRMWWGSLEAMAKVHKLDWRNLGFDFLGAPGSDTGPVDSQLDYYERFLSWARAGSEESHPILETAMAWLKDHRYVPEHVTLCWGDCRMPNTIYSPSPEFKVLAVLDWELAYIGDPISDLAWFLFLDWLHSDGAGTPKLEGTPGKSETVEHYESVTGWEVENLFYQEVMSAFRLGVIMVKIHSNFRKMGIRQADDADLNNPCTRRLAGLLNLPAPGVQQRMSQNIEDIAATIQFHLTGRENKDWYVVVKEGKGIRHEGVTDNPNIRLSASAEDWELIQRGQISRIHAWQGSKIQLEGDQTLFWRLERILSAAEFVD